MRKCPSCGCLTLDEVRDRDRWECTRNVSCGYVEPFVGAKDARIAELEAQVAGLKRIINAMGRQVRRRTPRQEDGRIADTTHTAAREAICTSTPPDWWN